MREIISFIGNITYETEPAAAEAYDSRGSQQAIHWCLSRYIGVRVVFGVGLGRVQNLARKILFIGSKNYESKFVARGLWGGTSRTKRTTQPFHSSGLFLAT